MVKINSLITILATSTLIQSHPGQPHSELFAELRERTDFISKLENTNLQHCQPKLAKRDGHGNGIVERRAELLKTLRRGKGLDKNAAHLLAKRQIKQEGLDLNSIMAAAALLSSNAPPPPPLTLNHKTNLTISNPRQADWTLLGQNKSVVLTPRIPEGPYYVSGEHIRKDIRDKEPGVELVLDIQVVDINTCLPIPNMAVELYQSNSSGVYSGVIDFVNGEFGKDNVKKEALRGIQMTGEDGAVQFQTIFPGQYGGRAQHIHVATHLNSIQHPNKTISGGTIPHVGVVYFDEDLLTAVSKVPPYTNNRNRRMPNKGDIGVLMGTVGGADPFLEYTLLSNDIKDGVLGWINMAVDTRVNASITAASTCTAEGCKSPVADMMDAFKGVGNGLAALLDALRKPTPAGSTPAVKGF